jgi:hypothetical protein
VACRVPTRERNASLREQLAPKIVIVSRSYRLPVVDEILKRFVPILASEPKI